MLVILRAGSGKVKLIRFVFLLTWYLSLSLLVCCACLLCLRRSLFYQLSDGAFEV
jgi:hypothetical protein